MLKKHLQFIVLSGIALSAAAAFGYSLVSRHANMAPAHNQPSHIESTAGASPASYPAPASLTATASGRPTASAIGAQIGSKISNAASLPTATSTTSAGLSSQPQPSASPGSIPPTPPKSSPPPPLPPPVSVSGAFNAKTFLQQFVPGAAHEVLPHGVPTSKDWSTHAVLHTKIPPLPGADYVNLWGQLYVGPTNVHPANTRVEIAGCKQWALLKGASSWQVIVNGTTKPLGGGTWAEDFSAKTGAINFRTESDGWQSAVPPVGSTAHFWSNSITYLGSNLVDDIVICSQRLVLANPSQHDDRDSAQYAISIGADWKTGSSSCPIGPYGIAVCKSMQIGKFVKVTRNWRLTVASSMTAVDLKSLPLPPDSAFKLPDGTYPAM